MARRASARDRATGRGATRAGTIAAARGATTRVGTIVAARGATSRAAVIAVMALALSALSACAGPWLPVATTADVARVQPRWPTATVDELNHGRSLVIRRCSNCHQPPSPADRAAADWPAEVADMAERSGLAAGEDELLTRYLVAFARDQVVAPR